MKKVMALFLIVCICLSLCACGLDTAPTKSDGTNPSQNRATLPSQNKDPNSTQNKEPDPTQNKENEHKFSFTETIVVDNDQCIVKITGIEYDNIWGLTLKALLENKSSDKTYMFAVESAAINGVECDPFFATEVAAGKKSNNKITFSDNIFDGNEVGDYTDIELTIHVYDTNDWSADDVARETVHIYPYGEDKAVKFVREKQPTDNVLFDNDYITVIVTGYEIDEIWGYTVNLFFINKTDREVMFSVDEASVNGFMLDPFFAKSVGAGKCAFSSMTWSNSALEENSITEIEEIEFLFRAYDSEEWSAEDYVNETITLKP